MLWSLFPAIDQQWLHRSQVVRLWQSCAIPPKVVVLKFILITPLPILFMSTYLSNCVNFYGLFFTPFHFPFPPFFFRYYGKDWLISLGGGRNDDSQPWVWNVFWGLGKWGLKEFWAQLSIQRFKWNYANLNLMNWQDMNWRQVSSLWGNRLTTPAVKIWLVVFCSQLGKNVMIL